MKFSENGLSKTFVNFTLRRVASFRMTFTSTIFSAITEPNKSFPFAVHYWFITARMFSPFHRVIFHRERFLERLADLAFLWTRRVVALTEVTEKGFQFLVTFIDKTLVGCHVLSLNKN